MFADLHLFLICFNECFAHQPDSCPKQFGLTEVRSNLIEYPKIKSKKRSAGTKGRNWEDGIFSPYIQLWSCRKEHFIGNPSHPLHPMRSPPPASSSSPHVSLGGDMRSPPPPASPPPASSSSTHVSQGGAMRSPPPPPASPPPASSSSPHVRRGKRIPKTSYFLHNTHYDYVVDNIKRSRKRKLL